MDSNAFTNALDSHTTGDTHFILPFLAEPVGVFGKLVLVDEHIASLTNGAGLKKILEWI